MTAPEYLRLIDTRGVGRYDVTPLFADATAFTALLDDLARPFADAAVDLVAGIDALGFVLGAALATRLRLGFVPLRKGGKLPVPADTASFVDYSGGAKSLELRRGAVPAGARVMLVDEWIETGAQVGAAIGLVEGQGGIVAGVVTLAMDDNAATQALRVAYRCHAVWLLEPEPETEKGASEMTTNTTDDLIAALAAIPDRLDALARRAASNPAPAIPKPAAGVWTPSEVAGHLCDAARYWGARMRLVVHEQSPALEPYDEEGEVRLAAYRYWPLDVLLREFRVLAEDTVAFLRGLPSGAWDRAGVHTERGSLSLREIVAIEADHEENHVRQLAQTLGALEDGENSD